MKDILLVLIGGACSAFGGLAATWYRARKAGKIKFDETIAERKVVAYAKALELIRRLQSILLRGMTKDAHDFIYENGSWFADSLILLPQTYVENWRSIRVDLESAVLKDAAKEETRDELKRDALATEITDSWQSSIELAREAEASIWDELKAVGHRTKHPRDAEATRQSKRPLLRTDTMRLRILIALGIGFVIVAHAFELGDPGQYTTGGLIGFFLAPLVGYSVILGIIAVLVGAIKRDIRSNSLPIFAWLFLIAGIIDIVLGVCNQFILRPMATSAVETLVEKGLAMGHLSDSISVEEFEELQSRWQNADYISLEEWEDLKSRLQGADFISLEEIGKLQRGCWTRLVGRWRNVDDGSEIVYSPIDPSKTGTYTIQTKSGYIRPVRFRAISEDDGALGTRLVLRDTNSLCSISDKVCSVSADGRQMTQEYTIYHPGGFSSDLFSVYEKVD